MSHNIEAMEDFLRVLRIAKHQEGQIELTCKGWGRIKVNPEVLTVSADSVKIGGGLNRVVTFEDLTDYRIK